MSASIICGSRTGAVLIDRRLENRTPKQPASKL
jgi:hypothetical protein